MTIVAISDTHQQHQNIKLPSGDILIHTGDITNGGTRVEVVNFLEWFSIQPHLYKILIAGNHDYLFESSPHETSYLIPQNVVYLENSGVVIEGISIWGSPVQPFYQDMAFNKQRGNNIQKFWDLIPNDTDILITHGPAHGVLDRNIHSELVGCKDLMKAIDRVKPAYHIFGHIHEAYGLTKIGTTTFINASSLNENNLYTNEPMVIGFSKIQSIAGL